MAEDMSRPTCIDQEKVPADYEPCERGWDVASIGEGQEHCPHLGGVAGGDRLQCGGGSRWH